MENHKYLDKIRSNESSPKVYKNFFSDKELEDLIDLYQKLPVTVHNKNQNVIKKRWLKKSNEVIVKHFISFRKF
jgi:hypothetical protein